MRGQKMTAYIPKAELVCQLLVDCSAPVPIGRQRGGNAVMISIVGGTVSGERLSGEVLSGGADWAIIRDDGLVMVDARYAIKTSDGTIIQVFNSGANRMSRGTAGAPPVMLTTPRFVAPEGEHDWLNHSVFVGTLTPDASGKLSPVNIGIFKLA
jgi:Protein of unknown function (DUF3237)